jgi:hypothetical protein
LEEGGWPIGFHFLDSRWILDCNEEATAVDYIFRADGTKVCAGECTGVCSGGTCDGGREDSALSFRWTVELLETGESACGTLGYDTKEEFIVALVDNAGWSMRNVIISAFEPEPGYDEYDACRLLQLLLLLGCDVNAVIPSMPEKGLYAMTPLQWSEDLDLPVVCQYLRDNDAVLWEK